MKGLEVRDILIAVEGDTTVGGGDGDDTLFVGTAYENSRVTGGKGNDSVRADARHPAASIDIRA